MKNKGSGYCYICGRIVEIGEGIAVKRDGWSWSVRCKAPCSPEEESDLDSRK